MGDHFQAGLASIRNDTWHLPASVHVQACILRRRILIEVPVAVIEQAWRSALKGGNRPICSISHSVVLSFLEEAT